MRAQRLILLLTSSTVAAGSNRCGDNGVNPPAPIAQADGKDCSSEQMGEEDRDAMDFGRGGDDLHCKATWCITNVKDFGAKGDGRHDDTGAFQAAINSLPHGGQVYIPASASSYLISSTLAITNVTGLSLVGSARGGSVLRWGSSRHECPPAAGVPMIRITNGFRVSIKSLAIYGNQDHPPSSIIESRLATDQLPDGGQESSRNVFEDLVLGGDLPGMADRGIQYDKTPLSHDEANDVGNFTRVEILNVAAAAVSFEQGQTRSNVFVGCRFTDSQRGVATSLGEGVKGGSFRWYGGEMGRNSLADFDLGNPDDVILISGLSSQGSGSLLLTNGPSSTAWPITIESVRWAANGLNDDGKMISYQHEGPINLIGNIMGDSYHPSPGRASPTIFLNFAIDGTANLIGNTFLAPGSVDRSPISTLGPGPYHIMMQGNTFSDAIGVAKLRSDPSTTTGAYAGLLGISATTTASSNLRGKVFTSGSSAVCSVTFDTPEVDDKYFLVVTPGAFAGAGDPPAGSNRVLSISKAAAGFNVTAEAAPGGDNSMEFDWVLIR